MYKKKTLEELKDIFLDNKIKLIILPGIKNGQKIILRNEVNYIKERKKRAYLILGIIVK